MAKLISKAIYLFDQCVSSLQITICLGILVLNWGLCARDRGHENHCALERDLQIWAVDQNLKYGNSWSLASWQ